MTSCQSLSHCCQHVSPHGGEQCKLGPTVNPFFLKLQLPGILSKKNISHIKNNCSIYLNFSLLSRIDGKGTYSRAFISTHTLCVCYSRATLLCLLLMFMTGRNSVQRTISEESLLLALSYMTLSWSLN